MWFISHRLQFTKRLYKYSWSNITSQDRDRVYLLIDWLIDWLILDPPCIRVLDYIFLTVRQSFCLLALYIHCACVTRDSNRNSSVCVDMHKSTPNTAGYDYITFIIPLMCTMHNAHTTMISWWKVLNNPSCVLLNYVQTLCLGPLTGWPITGLR